jgi:tetratricopeptide (TPR) repeat protein
MERIRTIKTLQKIGCLFLAGILLVSCGTRTEQPGKSKLTLTSKHKKALADFNRGAGLLEQYKYTDAARAFERVCDAAPDWTAARFNLGLAYFNMHGIEVTEKGKTVRPEYLKKAKVTFEAVLQSDPDHLYARFCLGLYYEYAGESDNALKCFQQVYEDDRQDLHAAHKYGVTLLTLGRNEEGTKVLEEVVARDPGFVSAVYRLALQYMRNKQPERAMPLFDRFTKLKDTELTGGTFIVLKAYGTVGKYYMALGADNLPLPSVQTPQQTRILFSPELKPLSAKTSAWKCPGGAVALPGIVAGDVDDDGDLDLCITAFGANGKVWLWRNDGDR